MTPEEQLYELLSSKTAEQLANNEKETNKSVLELHLPSKGFTNKETSEVVIHKIPSEHEISEGVLNEAAKTRERVTENAFNGLAKARAANQAVIAKNFSHSGNYETHSLSLAGKRATESLKTASLMERVRKITGRI